VLKNKQVVDPDTICRLSESKNRALNFIRKSQNTSTPFRSFQNIPNAEQSRRVTQRRGSRGRKVSFHSNMEPPIHVPQPTKEEIEDKKRQLTTEEREKIFNDIRDHFMPLHQAEEQKDELIEEHI